MKEVEVEIVSKEDIKPSSPTPSNLEIFKLCLLDHLIPAPYAPIIFFYPSLTLSERNPNANILHLLKQSLSQTLTLFYPLAGKIKDDFSIHCNDEGANFVEAKVKCPLSEFLTNPDLISLHKLLPCDLNSPKESYVETYVSNIQVSVFYCGGISIGLCISHRILDGASLSSFLKVWTSKATGNHKEVVKPEILMASSLFPMDSDDDDNSLWLRDSSMAMWGSMFKNGKFVTRRFWFSNSAIAKLKDQMVNSSVCRGNDMVKNNPTRLEIVSAMLWKSFLDASKAQSDCRNNSTQLKRASLASHLVNLRKRIKTDDLSCRSAENAIGNLLWLAFAKSNMADNKSNNYETRLDGLVKKLRKALSTINDKFIENILTNNFTRKSTMLQSLNIKSKIDEDEEEEGSKNDKGEVEEEVECLGFSSWCNFGFNEVDFGWGKPLWVSSIGTCGSSVYMNLVVLVDSRFGDDGIEAWVTLDEPFMAHLETNSQLLGYAILDPSPLTICSKQLDCGSRPL